MTKAVSSQPKTKRGIERRAKILAAAEQVIGEKGFAAASIADITRAADTASGTFYIYFSGKDVLFRELVEDMGRATRSQAAERIATAANRLEAERAGLEAYLIVVRDRPMQYRIVEEARFVDPDAYRTYYSEFGKAYADQLQQAAERGEISAGDAEVRAWALMGIAKTLGERFVLWEEGEVDIERVVAEAHQFICNGLAP
ncbi:TetR/AcrR family transcriptional regulator [Thalassovita mediterranea]|jgi:AcrR family transcriptional regulator|uniref:Putative HTH-type transcriptional regulator YvdT n=1 Tax=Thalassovita mediterranea TaxID=340021 RepID=A0A0P1GNT3_9RHOB|nr:TetR/AcrR family transcriptional regulator [Thalassovita mediterranea]MCG7573183.1 TetR/AcrR family transcriptional regulator [Phaeobacter sp. CNT1-3]CUH84111.1 putative HTH-type transcriptional regulator YvdT [Thalassovita mediterranea]SIS27711.1 transcriptional regulator, TetR family [Thalassovita mediterranea]